MPGKSVRKSAAPSRGRDASSHRRPSVSPKRGLKPPSSQQRSRSHESDRHDSSQASRSSRRDSDSRPAAPRRRSTHRSSISPPSRYTSPRRDDRRPRSSHRRRESFSPDDSARDRMTRDRLRFDDSGQRGRPISPMPSAFRTSNTASPPYVSGGNTPAPYLPVSSTKSQTQPRPATPAAITKPAATPSATASSTTNDSVKPAPAPAHHTSSSDGLAGLFGKVPTAFVAYTGVKELSKHADKAKEWADWFKELGETPEEIDELSAKAITARDTITQIQGMLEARPDLLEGETGKTLKEQIEEAVKKTDKTLGKMTKILSELSSDSAQEGTVHKGLMQYWNSYQYKTEWKDKIEAADADLQKDLAGLSTLMVNVYSRAIKNPGPPGSTAVPVPGPMQAPGKIGADAKSPSSYVPSVTANAPPTLGDTNKESIAAASNPNTTAPPFLGTIPPAGPNKENKSGVPVVPAAAMAAATIAKTAPPPPPSNIPEIVEPMLKEKAMANDSLPLHSKQTVPEPPPEPIPTTDEDAFPPSPGAVADAEEVIGLDLSKDSERKRTKHSPPPVVPPPGGVAPPETDPYKDPEDSLLDAAWDGDIDGVASALRHAPATTCDLRGLTPLHLASERDHLAIAIMLLDRGADVHARANGGRMPLHLAARFATADTVEMLLERARANPNAETSDGRTPLHYAASAAEDGDEGRREVIRVLRDWGANPTVEDRKGETPRDVTQKRNFWDAASTLKRAEKRWDEDHDGGRGQNWLQRHGLMKK